MKIIIAGCGKIGTALTRTLLKERHDVTVIDAEPRRVDELINMFDVQGVYGNAADSDVLTDAGVARADLFIAVTASDELNMLACFFAYHMGTRHTIARIRDTDYNDRSLAFMKDSLRLSMTLNPDYMAAQQALSILRMPSAVQIETFSNRNMEIVQLKLKPDSPVCGKTLVELRRQYKLPFLICTVERGDQVYIPDGNFRLLSGDKIGLVAAPTDHQKLLKQFDMLHKQARDVMIFGGSRTAYYLAKHLTTVGNSVKIVDKDPVRCREIAALLPSVSVVEGDGTDQELLYEEGVRSMDAFIAVTGSDEENILLSVFAASLHVPTVITKVNSDAMLRLAEKLGLDCLISQKKAVTDVVTRYVRALSNSEGSKIETLYRIADEKAEALEFIVSPDFKGREIPLRDLKLKHNTLIAGIVRKGKTLIPSGADCILPGDRVIVISAGHSFRDLADILK